MNARAPSERVRASLVVKLMASVVLLLAGCLPNRVAFEPKAGPPLCDGKAGEYAPAEWAAFNADVTRLAKAMQFDESDPTLVHVKLELAVHELADHEGCVVGGVSVKLDDYTLACGTLSPDLERYRANLQTVVRENLKAANASAKSYEAKCGGVAMMALVWTNALGFGRDQAGNNAGCSGSPAATEACQRGCDNGNPDACDAVWSNATDDNVKRLAVVRECDVRLKTKGDPKMSTMCGIAIGDEVKSASGGTSGAKEIAQKLVSGVCAAEPTGSVCTMYSGKIEAMSLPLGPPLPPGGGFYCMDLPNHMMCAREDCAQTAALLAIDAKQPIVCHQRPHAYCSRTSRAPRRASNAGADCLGARSCSSPSKPTRASSSPRVARILNELKPPGARSPNNDMSRPSRRRELRLQSRPVGSRTASRRPQQAHGRLRARAHLLLPAPRR